MPVFRHGSEAARICDEALSVSGPTDPRIAKIIQTDQNAQMAYHIHKALGFALEVKTTVIEYYNFSGAKAPPCSSWDTGRIAPFV